LHRQCCPAPLPAPQHCWMFLFRISLLLPNHAKVHMITLQCTI
jgi:hypothetical protein